ncbi:SRPBCC domain-containing protein [Phreatobacter cathodiphilus]|uniref:Polyketide cyclase n=1 Tax=Phreatobacter cathodiphilus TaxID=1868589 RepID=A0A2S0NAE5_9HYPH|nr:SRPBCC domain-containing protein [Phreatobacter cathodiphilus]AVO45118.1 polyketide cyclase [Phreatobacter cathodiphilus]
MTVTNASFTIERVLNASPARVFAAYTTIEAKSQWFRAPAEIETLDRHLDFRPGGEERFRARWPGGLETDFQATYHDIVENERIILVYDLFHNRDKLSVSLLTLEFRAEGSKTRLLHTEQGSYLVGGAEAVQGRQHGTTWHIDNLVALIEGHEPRAFS